MMTGGTPIYENHQMVTLKHQGVILTIGIISYLPIPGGVDVHKQSMWSAQTEW